MSNQNLKDDIIKIIAHGLDSWEATQTDPAAALLDPRRDAMERYLGKEHPYPYVEFNHFKPMVDTLAAMVLRSVDEHIDERIAELESQNKALREAAQNAVEYMRLSSPHPSQAMDELDTLLQGNGQIA